MRVSERRDTYLSQNPHRDNTMSLRACFENGWCGRPARPGRRPADRNCSEQCCEKALLIASNRRSRSVRRVAGYVFSAHTRGGPGARDLSRRNTGTSDRRLEISRFLRLPIFLRTEVRAPFARATTALNSYVAERHKRVACGTSKPFIKL